jgi:hypothetical protein
MLPKSVRQRQGRGQGQGRAGGRERRDYQQATCGRKPAGSGPGRPARSRSRGRDLQQETKCDRGKWVPVKRPMNRSGRGPTVQFASDKL